MSTCPRGMGLSPFKNLSTPAKSLIAQCSSPAQRDTSFPLTRQLRSKRRYSRASGVQTMQHPCTSKRSVPGRGASAYGDARYAARPPQAITHSRQQVSKNTEVRAKKQDLEFLGRLKVESCASPPLSLRNPVFRAPQQTFRPPSVGSKPHDHEIELQWGNEFL